MKTNIITPKIYFYRNYNKINYELFQITLIEHLRFLFANNNCEHGNFESYLQILLNEYVPVKKKVFRTDDSPFTRKELRKAMMVIPFEQMCIIFKTKQKFCYSSIYSTENTYCVWKKIRPCFSDKMNP